jgi:hypothetical protein
LDTKGSDIGCVVESGYILVLNEAREGVSALIGSKSANEELV